MTNLHCISSARRNILGHSHFSAYL